MEKAKLIKQILTEETNLDEATRCFKECPGVKTFDYTTSDNSDLIGMCEEIVGESKLEYNEGDDGEYDGGEWNPDVWHVLESSIKKVIVVLDKEQMEFFIGKGEDFTEYKENGKWVEEYLENAFDDIECHDYLAEASAGYKWCCDKWFTFQLVPKDVFEIEPDTFHILFELEVCENVKR
jgi:hypothetical protein